jgi:hypothetical protein
MNTNNTSNVPATTGSDSGSTSGSTPAQSPSTGPDKYLATFFFAEGHDVSSKGTIAVDSTANDGTGKVELNLGTFGPNSTFTLQFCPGGDFQNCFDVGTVTTDSMGEAKSNFVFPRKGTFSGVFTLTSGGTIFFYAGINASGSEPSFSSTLLPIGAVVGASPSDGSGGVGTVLVVGQTGHITLHGATANHTYDVAFTCGNSACQTIGTLTTNGQGNGSADVPVTSLGFAGGIGLADSSGLVYVSAFRVN